MAFKKRRYWDNQPQEAVPVKDLGFTEVFTGASIGYNHATGKQIAVTAGGTGFSQRATPYGLSLYTPNGGWADLAVDLDWSGPNTVSCLVILRGIDANYGGLYSKNSSGTSTQFGVGRDATSNNLYLSVSDAVARPVTASSISALIGVPSILTVTHSGTAATYGYLYLNGVLVGQTSLVLGTQPTGKGSLGLGRERASNASFDSDVDWLGFARAPRVMDAAEIQQYFSTPQSFWGLFAPQTIPVPVSASGGTVTLAAQDAAHAHALDNAALSIGVTLTVADLAHGHALDASTLSTGTALAVADSLHAHALDNVTLSTTGAVSLTVADSLHAHTLDAVVLTSQTDLAAADMAHGHALDGVTLTLGGISLVIAEIMHAHALDNVALTLDTYLAVADILHAHTLDNVLVSIPGGTLDLILKILVNRQELNPATGTFTLYDDDGVTVLYTTSAWADAAGTVPYSGGALRRIDALF